MEDHVELLLKYVLVWNSNVGVGISEFQLNSVSIASKLIYKYPLHQTCKVCKKRETKKRGWNRYFFSNIDISKFIKSWIIG